MIEGRIYFVSLDEQYLKGMRSSTKGYC